MSNLTNEICPKPTGVYEVEIWRGIKGYEELYQVSNFGRARSLDRIGDNGRLYKGIVKKLSDNGKGYFHVNLKVRGKQESRYIHRAVAEAFIPNPENKPEVNHKDANKANNFVENLEWCDHTENNNHAFDSGLIKIGKTTYVINTNEKSINAFRSQAKASVFMGKNEKFVSGRATAGSSNRVGDYEFFFDEAEATTRLEGL